MPVSCLPAAPAPGNPAFTGTFGVDVTAIRQTIVFEEPAPALRDTIIFGADSSKL
jgi:hypothetical protein